MEEIFFFVKMMRSQDEVKVSFLIAGGRNM
jgi:hypothetical protein